MGIVAWLTVMGLVFADAVGSSLIQFFERFKYEVCQEKPTC